MFQNLINWIYVQYIPKNDGDRLCAITKDKDINLVITCPIPTRCLLAVKTKGSFI